jgi:cardiolipin synthase
MKQSLSTKMKTKTKLTLTLFLFGFFVAFLSFYLLLPSQSPKAVITPIIDTAGAATYYKQVHKAITEAKKYVYVMIFKISYSPDQSCLTSGLLQALLQAKERGVEVRVILERSDWSPEVNEENERTAHLLRSQGVLVRFDSVDITTHAKLVIVDDLITILGSSNWSYWALSVNYEAGVVIENEAVAKSFAEFFERIWDTSPTPPGRYPLNLFDQISAITTIIPIPDDDNSTLYYDLVSKTIEGATRSILVMMYQMSSTYSLERKLIGSLIKAKERGVEVKVILEQGDQKRAHSLNQKNRETAQRLKAGNILVRLDPPQITTHVKLVIIDGKTTIIGSTNWSYRSLERNIEASVLITNPKVAASFVRFFRMLWNQSFDIN